MSNILVVAGIKEDARLIIEELLKMNFSLTVAVTSRLGASWLKKYKGLTIKEGKLNLEVLSNIIEDTEVICLIDVSQPSARDTSLNAMKACKRKGIPYLRFEAATTRYLGEEVICFKNCDEAVNKLECFPGNILLHVGHGKIDSFFGVHDFRNRVYVLAFPESANVAKYERLGLNAGHIIAVKEPISESLYIQILKHCNICVVVSKCYINAGGDFDFISAAKKLGIPFIIVEKEGLSYGNEANSINEVVKFVKNLKGS